MLLYIFCIGFAVLTPPLFAGSGNLLGWQKGNTDARLLDGCVCMVHIFNLFGLVYIQKNTTLAYLCGGCSRTYNENMQK